MVRLKASGITHTYWVRTSMMVAIYVNLFTKTRRPVEMRYKAFNALRSLVEAACSIGVDLVATHIDLDGNEYDHHFHLQGSALVKAQDLWNEDFYLTHLADEWAQKLNDQKCPWISSPGSVPHLADWLAFVLDIPQTERIRSLRNRKSVVEAKKAYSGSALGILTQLAQCFDSNIVHCTEPVGLKAMHDDRGLGWISIDIKI